MEFNSVNFNINIVNQKAGLVKNSQQQAQTPQQQILPQTQPSSTQYINPSLMYDFQSVKMDNETVLKYLQNLMKLPNSIDKFVNQLNTNNIDPKLSKILIENMISVKALSEFLNQNSNEAISKLMQTISLTLKSGTSDVSQLKEILSILGAIQNSTSLNQNALKELLLLYIPLNIPVFDKNIDGEIKNEEERNTLKNSKISILFETINFSNLLISINESENNLFVDFFAPNNFPKQEFAKIVEALSKEVNLVSIFEFKDRLVLENKNEISNFKVISDGFVSPNVLMLAHIIINSVLKIDKKS